MTWYVDDGVVRFNGPGLPQADGPVVEVNVRNGMLARPIETDEGAEVRMFLRPEVVLGCTLVIESETVNGRWKVVTLKHSGDNWQSKGFETWCDLRALN